MQALSDLKSSLSDINLQVYDRKCELFLASSYDDTKTFPVPLSANGIEILGVPIGQDHFVTERCIKVAESGQEL